MSTEFTPVSEKSHAATRYGGDAGGHMRHCYAEIDGVRYDTAESEEIENSFGFFDDMMVSVYRTQSGQWFLTEEKNSSGGTCDDDITIQLILPEEVARILADFRAADEAQQKEWEEDERYEKERWPNIAYCREQIDKLPTVAKKFDALNKISYLKDIDQPYRITWPLPSWRELYASR
jgi:hypothetical protein